MPELPEVETVCRVLSKNIVGLTIKKAKIINKKLRYPLTSSIEKKILKSKIKLIIRRGKYGLILLSNRYLIIFHLGMTGKFKIDLRGYKKIKHDHLVIEFDNNLKLIYNDIRKFGYIELLEKPFDVINLKNLGYEPSIVANFRDDLFNAIKKRKTSIKDILLDQNFICGVGNIYASEILYRAKISPFKKGVEFNKNELVILLNALQNIIEQAIKKGGSSIKDFRNTKGKKGSYQEEFAVYDRENKNCKSKNCNSKITKMNISNRSTFICNYCQKK